MNKEILKQYRFIDAEVKDIKKRIKSMQKELNNLDIVSDSVKGTRLDGTYGSIRITGFPKHEYFRKNDALHKSMELLDVKEAALLELMEQTEAYIESIPKSEIRTMFRLYYMDGLTWVQVAHKMNELFGKRHVKFTEDGCRMRNKRFFEEN